VLEHIALLETLYGLTHLVRPGVWFPSSIIALRKIDSAWLACRALQRSPEWRKRYIDVGLKHNGAILFSADRGLREQEVGHAVFHRFELADGKLTKGDGAPPRNQMAASVGPNRLMRARASAYTRNSRRTLAERGVTFGWRQLKKSPRASPVMAASSS
jgi:hypothetical protein